MAPSESTHVPSSINTGDPFTKILKKTPDVENWSRVAATVTIFQSEERAACVVQEIPPSREMVSFRFWTRIKNGCLPEPRPILSKSVAVEEEDGKRSHTIRTHGGNAPPSKVPVAKTTSFKEPESDSDPRWQIWATPSVPEMAGSAENPEVPV
jgi:hypothetical protein